VEREDLDLYGRKDEECSRIVSMVAVLEMTQPGRLWLGEIPSLSQFYPAHGFNAVVFIRLLSVAVFE
jgi:hypothetical protein